jgi:hypothetical protein
MKKIIVIFLVLVLAWPFVLRADPQVDLKGMVVRISGAMNALGVVLLYKAGYCIILEEVDGSKQQVFDLKNRDYRLEILAGSRETFLDLQSDGLAPGVTPSVFKLAPTVIAFRYLSEITARARKLRFSAAIPSLIAGGVISTNGISTMAVGGSDAFALGGITLAIGLVVGGVGVLHLSQKTSAERSYEHAQKLTDEELNAFCAAALKTESRKAKAGRYINAGLCIGLAAIVQMVSINNFRYEDIPAEDTFAFLLSISPVIGFGFSALYNIAFPSYEEKMYRRYLEEKAIVEQSNKLTLNFGLVPRGFALGMRYYFQ